MERILSLSTFEREESENSSLTYWLSRPHEERIAEVERLRREYLESLQGAARNGCPEGFCRSLRLVERQEH